MHAQLLEIKIRAVCLPSIVIDNAIGSSDLDYQAADMSHLLSSVCLSDLTNLVQSILASDRGLEL